VQEKFAAVPPVYQGSSVSASSRRQDNGQLAQMIRLFGLGLGLGFRAVPVQNVPGLQVLPKSCFSPSGQNFPGGHWHSTASAVPPIQACSSGQMVPLLLLLPAGQ
jgi:hypothetical protein